MAIYLFFHAPSGAGKSSLISALLKQGSARQLQVSVSTTTRATLVLVKKTAFITTLLTKPALNNKSKTAYFTSTLKCLVTTMVHLRTAIDEQLAQGIDVFLDIDWQGAQQVRIKRPDVTTIFIAPPSRQELENRLRGRGQDSDEVIADRMAKAQALNAHTTKSLTTSSLTMISTPHWPT